MNEIKTKITVRPYKPIQETNREPFAVLTYGGVTVELDYTLLRYLTFNCRAVSMSSTVRTASVAPDEILREMDYAITGHLSTIHRYGDSDYCKDPHFNPLHPEHSERIKIEKN